MIAASRNVPQECCTFQAAGGNGNTPVVPGPVLAYPHFCWPTHTSVYLKECMRQVHGGMLPRPSARWSPPSAPLPRDRAAPGGMRQVHPGGPAWPPLAPGNHQLLRDRSRQGTLPAGCRPQAHPCEPFFMATQCLQKVQMVFATWQKLMIDVCTYLYCIQPRVPEQWYLN